MITYNLRRTTEPSVEPLTLDTLKSALRVDHANDDAELTRLLASARRSVERDSRRALITQTWTLNLDAWPSGGIVLYNPPIQSVTSVKYLDTGGDQQTWSSANYSVDTDDEPGMIRLGYGKTYPALRGDARGIEVIYVAGYGNTAGDVPDSLQRAVIEHVRMYFDGLCDELLAAYQALVRAEAPGVYP